LKFLFFPIPPSQIRDSICQFRGKSLTQNTRRIACDYRVRFYGFCHDRARTDNCAIANNNPWKDDNAISDPDIIAHYYIILFRNESLSRQCILHKVIHAEAVGIVITRDKSHALADGTIFSHLERAGSPHYAAIAKTCSVTDGKTALDPSASPYPHSPDPNRHKSQKCIDQYQARERSAGKQAMDKHNGEKLWLIKGRTYLRDLTAQ